MYLGRDHDFPPSGSDFDTGLAVEFHSFNVEFLYIIFIGSKFVNLVIHTILFITIMLMPSAISRLQHAHIFINPPRNRDMIVILQSIQTLIHQRYTTLHFQLLKSNIFSLCSCNCMQINLQVIQNNWHIQWIAWSFQVIRFLTVDE